MKLEVAPIGIRFECSHAVYLEGAENSLCYVTSEERGEFIADAFARLGELEDIILKAQKALGNDCPLHSLESAQAILDSANI